MGKETDKIQGESNASYRLSTMIPFEVFTEFVRFCKENSRTGMDKFDYGVGLRILLMKAKYADKLEKIESRLTKLEGGNIDG